MLQEIQQQTNSLGCEVAFGLTAMPNPRSGVGLNPLAAAFVPTAQRKQEDLEYTGWGNDGRARRRPLPKFSPHPPGEQGSCSWRDLPKEVSTSSPIILKGRSSKRIRPAVAWFGSWYGRSPALGTCM